MTTFAEQLRRARKDAGFTQDTFATEIQMDRTNYVRYETGDKLPAPKTIFRIAKALKKHPGDILMWMAEELGE